MKLDVKPFLNGAKLTLKKHSPEILVFTGIGGMIGSTAMACKATRRLDPVLEKHKQDAEAVHKAYGDIIRMTPPPPSTYSLEFLSGGATLTPQSQSELDAILTAATSRPGGEIIITGHTDTTGTPEANDRISQERAEALRDFLTGRGFPAERVQSIGRGQRELLVPTGPGVDEAKNRRVVIVVR